MEFAVRWYRNQQVGKEIENKLIALIEDKTNALKTDIIRETNASIEAVEIIKESMETDIPRLQEAIKVESLEREDTNTALVNKANEEIKKLRDRVEAQRKAREETEEAMLEMLKDMVGRIKGEIEAERNDRKATEETLLGLLEDTCTKLTTMTNQV